MSDRKWSKDEWAQQEQWEQRVIAELEAFAEAYRAAEIAGTPVAEVAYAGWRPGARFGVGEARGELLARDESGTDAVCVFREGKQTLFQICSAGWQPDFTERPYSLIGVHPGITGALAPAAARLELIGPDGAAYPADVLNGTFAVDLKLSRTEELPETAPDEERIDAVWAAGDEAREALREYLVRIHDGAGAVLYQGPVLYGSWSARR